MQRLFTLAALLIPLCAAASAAASRSEAPVSSRLDAMAGVLTQAARSRGQPRSETLAVFTFNSSERLSAARIGFAVSELLTHHFVKRRVYTVVERTNLEKVMREQRLQVSGAVDAAGAVRVGKVLGARLLVLGSVEKVAGNYQVNARIVDAESTQVLGTAYEEFPARAFEEDARPYLLLVPDRHALGLYLLYNFRRNTAPGAYRSFSQNLVNQTLVNEVSPESFPLSMIGGGLRYLPTSAWLADLSLAVSANRPRFASVKSGYPGQTVDTAVPRTLGTTILVRATVSRIFGGPAGFRGIVGAGLSSMNSSGDRATFGTAIAPCVRGAIEHKPNARIGLGLAVNYDFIGKAGGDRDSGDRAFRFNPLSVEPSLAIYF
ncbi:MAG: hypothetical protein HY554_04655 [Elusimicrobia bacterium]|nr:hypothetical protein [Elusimicrobiota bacterium]